MKLNKLLSICLGITLAFSVSANDLSEARIYINPGHGGWGPNDRPMATINYAQMDTLGFFETNTNLIKGMALREELVKAGARYVRMSRTVNGVVAADDEHKTENDKYIETQPGESGTQQLVTLSVICQDVEANNMDYFISIHSNAATEGSSTNYPLILYRGTDSESGNGLTNARDMARAAWPYVNKNEVTYKSYYTGENDNNSRGDISFYGSSSSNSMGYTGYLGVLKAVSTPINPNAKDFSTKTTANKKVCDMLGPYVHGSTTIAKLPAALWGLLKINITLSNTTSINTKSIRSMPMLP